MEEELVKWLHEGRLLDVFVIARYQYRIGEPVVDDKTYDGFVKALSNAKDAKIKEVLSRTYDDDPIPFELLEELGEEPVAFLDSQKKGEFSEALAEEKSMSIDSVTTDEESWSFFRRCRALKQDISVSVKLDGVNSKSIWARDKASGKHQFRVSLSRGRDTGVCFDYTEGVACAVPTCWEDANAPDVVKVFAEVFVNMEYLDTLRDKYPTKKFKTEKSSAISMLRVKYSPEDYKHLNVMAFFAEGLSSTVSGTFERLEELGFKTPPHFLIEWEEIPETFEVFKEWIQTRIFNKLGPTRSYIPSDGIVLEINDLDFEGSISDQYCDRQLALKYGPWKFSLAKGVVTKIVIEQRRVYACAKVEINPVITEDGCEATTVNCFNPSILFAEGLHVGAEVYFERNSGAVNILVHGQRLQDLLQEKEAD